MPRGIRDLFDDWNAADAESRQARPMRCARRPSASCSSRRVKAFLAARYRDPEWRNVRPPLVAMGEADRAALLADPAIAGLLEAVTA